MALTRSQSTIQEGRVLSAPKGRGKRPNGIRKQSFRRTTRLQQRQSLERNERHQHHQSRDCTTFGSCGTHPIVAALDQELSSLQQRPRLATVKETLPRQDPSAAVQHTSRKRPIRDVRDANLDSIRKRQRNNTTHPAGDTSSKSAPNIRKVHHGTNPIEFWAKEGHWPEGLFQPNLSMDHLLARKKPSSNLSRKRSSSSTSSTPSDQKPRDEKSAPYRNTRYELLLETKGTYMDVSGQDVTRTSKSLVADLLNTDRPVPVGTVFDDITFADACRNLRGKNESRVVQDISRLLVPSAETLALRVKELRYLTESVNEGWSNSVPLTGTRPQPDYSIGFRREAFTDDQLAKLSPFLGDFVAGDHSFFMGTYYMYFPFLTCEVKCGTAALDVADRQNAHSTTLAVRAVAELLRAVKREGEINRQILAFSISHDHRSVRIYGHYPVLDGKNTKYYRHPIRTFDFTELDGKEKWTAYRFTRNIYEIWMPTHFKRICSAIDQLPSDLDFDNRSLPGTGLSQGLESHGLSQSDADSASLSVEQDSQSSNARKERFTPNTSFTDPKLTKKRKGKK